MCKLNLKDAEEFYAEHKVNIYYEKNSSNNVSNFTKF